MLLLLEPLRLRLGPWRRSLVLGEGVVVVSSMCGRVIVVLKLVKLLGNGRRSGDTHQLPRSLALVVGDPEGD